MTSGNFDSARCRRIYEAELRPVLQQCEPVIYLDARNEFYLSLMQQQGLLSSDRHLVDLGAGRDRRVQVRRLARPDLPGLHNASPLSGKSP